MASRSPLVTLLAVAVVGGVLLAVDAIGNPANNRVAGQAEPAAVTQTVPLTTPAPRTSAPPGVAEKAYAGRSSGNEVTVAIAVKEGRAVGYICDGRRVEAWLEGTVTGSDLTLRSKDGTSTISGTVDDTQSLGTVATGGKQWPYAAAAVRAPAGLYRGRADVRGVAVKIGWIVLPDGSVTGLGERAGAPETAPPLDPARPDGVAVDGVPVSIDTVGGDAEVWS